LRRHVGCVFSALILLTSRNLLALEPIEILIVANANVADGVTLATYYMQQRKIPETHLALVHVTNSETCERMDYVTKIAIPVRNQLKTLEAKGEPIRCLVIIYGIPLRINAPASKSLIDKLTTTPTLANDTESSLDSEIAMLRYEESYPVAGWIPNPYFYQFQKQQTQYSKETILMVSRLDAPTAAIVRRMIDASIAVEKVGLTGIAYFDARWNAPREQKLAGYAAYDQSLRLAAVQIRKQEIMPVVLDESEELFKPHECRKAALYCGWYSLGKYVDSFEWLPGSIGYHMASSECETLKKSSSQVWCKRMLEEGIAATIGPVGEPYIQAFPVPEIFFTYLIKGHLTLAECYIISLPYLSWKMVLIGDPLYFPFKR
jgi:uncharacterized protein (TIGR03790 family)